MGVAQTGGQGRGVALVLEDHAQNQVSDFGLPLYSPIQIAPSSHMLVSRLCWEECATHPLFPSHVAIRLTLTLQLSILAFR